jgi:hypothetical protein
MVFFQKFFVADSNQIAVSYCIGKVPAIEPIFCCGSQKYGFFGVLRISLKRKNPDKFFSAQKKRLGKSNPTVQNSLPYVAY